jgi:hypothetical protein
MAIGTLESDRKTEPDLRAVDFDGKCSFDEQYTDRYVYSPGEITDYHTSRRPVP